MRVVYGDNGVLTDLTRNLADYKSLNATFSYVTGQDYIYIGSDLPFNHFYIKMGSTVNAVAATMNIELWDGDEWIDVVEINDETGGLFASGYVDFVPDKDENWNQESTNHKGEQVTGLTSLVIYDQYWIRISFNATMTASTIVSWIGHKFSDDTDLYSEYPVLNSTTLKTAFEAGKTTWEEQHVRAADLLIKDLKSKAVIVSADQILKREDYRMAALCKTAQIIFQSMGDDYADDVIAAKNEYGARLDLSIHQVDQNADGRLDPKEKQHRVGFMTR